MLRKLFTSKKDDVRKLDRPVQLMVGDIVVLKYSVFLPSSLREKQLEVVKVGGYEYQSGVIKEVSLKDEESNVYFMSIEDEDGEESLCFSQKIPHRQVIELFGEDEFSVLWSDEWGEISVKNDVESLKGWYTEAYRQTIKEQQAYFYDRDPEGEDLTLSEDGDELRYHECEGGDDCFGLNIEMWGDGATDVFLQVFCPIDVIEGLYPHAE